MTAGWEELKRLAARSLSLPETNDHTHPHRRTRRDHAAETAEDYVEAVADIVRQQGRCRVIDLARRFDVSHVTVTRIVARLQSEGLLSTKPYQPISLTPQGKRLASKARHRHDIVFTFLRCIGVDKHTAAVDAEGIEHHVSPKTLRCFEQMIQQMEQ